MRLQTHELSDAGRYVNAFSTPALGVSSTSASTHKNPRSVGYCPKRRSADCWDTSTPTYIALSGSYGTAVFVRVPLMPTLRGYCTKGSESTKQSGRLSSHYASSWQAKMAGRLGQPLFAWLEVTGINALVVLLVYSRYCCTHGAAGFELYENFAGIFAID